MSTGKRSTPASQGSAARAAAPETRKRSKIPEVSLREGLFFDPQQGAWCGMHALNNYCLNGRLVQQQDCRDAARLVAWRLTDARAGDVEPISNHLDPLTGWLSIDVINVLGQANLGLHVEAARVSWPDGLRRQQDGAALVNWNKRHWTVLQRDPSGDGWMHTNSIEGVAPRYGRRRRLSDAAVHEVLEDIWRDARGVALHAITRANRRVRKLGKPATHFNVTSRGSCCETASRFACATPSLRRRLPAPSRRPPHECTTG